MRECRTCGQEIPAARIAAVPNAVQCVQCLQKEGDEPPVRGYTVWSGKTAPELEIGTRLASMEFGRKHRYGPHISFTQKSGPFGAERSAESANGLREISERLRREKRGEEDPDENLEPIR